MIEASWSCPKCHDRGWIRDPKGEGAGTARRCSCGGRSSPERLLEAAGIPDRYRVCDFDNFRITEKRGGEQLGARRGCQRYVESFIQADGTFCQKGLLLHGPVGTGKTHLVVAVLKALIRRYRVRGLFIDFTELVHRIQGSFDPNSAESKRGILDPLQDAELLVLDELGAQKPSAWVSDTLYLVINHRYAARRPTLFTTNYQPPSSQSSGSGLDRGADLFDSLAGRITDRLVSRLAEMTESPWIRLTSVEDYRQSPHMYRRGD